MHPQHLAGPEQAREDILRWMGALNAHDIQRLDQMADELCAPDYVRHPGAPRRPRGPEGARRMVRHILEHHPNLYITVLEFLAEGDKVAMRWEMHATDTAPPAQGDSVAPGRRMGLAILRFAHGQIAEEWELVGDADD